jgi:hypothetical protein
MCLNPQKSLKERKRTWTDLYYNSQQLSLGWTEGFSLASYSAITAFTSSYYAGLPSLKTHVLSVDAQHLAHCWAVYSWCLVNMLFFFFLNSCIEKVSWVLTHALPMSRKKIYDNGHYWRVLTPKAKDAEQASQNRGQGQRSPQGLVQVSS